MALANLNNNFWQMDAARKKIDPVMRVLVDMIDDAYYGTPNGTSRDANGWKHGVNNPFFLWDYIPGQDNKLKFDLISGIIHHLTFISQHLFNINEAEKYPESQYNHLYNLDGNLRLNTQGNPLTKVFVSKQLIKDHIIKYNAAGLTPRINNVSILTNWIKAHTIVAGMRGRKAKIVDDVFNINNDADIS